MSANRVVYKCDGNCVYKNLAIEDYLLHNTPPHQTCLLFYVNRASVVIGRNQSFFTEVNFPALPQAVSMARRLSGGGAVYHDLGNINYSVIMPRQVFDRRRAADMVCAALRAVKAELFVNERNDICMVGGQKVSGSAYRLVREKAYHHGTMLLSSDLAKLGHLLRSPVDIVEAPSICSVRSMVANVTPKLSVDDFIDLVVKQFDPTVEVITIPKDITVCTDYLTDPLWIYLKGSPHAFKFKQDTFRLKDGILYKNDHQIDDILSFLRQVELESITDRVSLLAQHKVPTQPMLSKDGV